METGTALSLKLWVWDTRVRWVLFSTEPGKTTRPVADGTLVRPKGMTEDEPYLAVLVSAMEAWRLYGPRGAHEGPPEAPAPPEGATGGPRPLPAGNWWEDTRRGRPSLISDGEEPLDE